MLILSSSSRINHVQNTNNRFKANNEEPELSILSPPQETSTGEVMEHILKNISKMFQPKDLGSNCTKVDDIKNQQLPSHEDAGQACFQEFKNNKTNSYNSMLKNFNHSVKTADIFSGKPIKHFAKNEKNETKALNLINSSFLNHKKLSHNKNKNILNF